MALHWNLSHTLDLYNHFVLEIEMVRFHLLLCHIIVIAVVFPDVAKILDTGVQYITASKTLIPTLLSLSPSEQDNRNSGQGLSALLPISDFNTAVYKASESYKYPCYLDATHSKSYVLCT